ncbi:MAG: lipopolysaccharide biosynthesis protein [Bacteroidaceae bacterium]|nr:lipopolysaccharide biosynthesis protein [Bacteroidaceae bacterium]
MDNNTIKHQLFSGVFYTAIAKYSGILISLIIAAILARLLSPEDFGIVAIATVIISFFNIFTDMGLFSAVIQKKDLTTHDLNNIYSFSIWTGLILALLFFAASWPISFYYKSSTLRILCQLLSIDLFFSSARIVPDALFFKNKEFKFIAIRSLVIQLFCGIAAIIAALTGAGLYALIIAPIFSSILLFIISYKRYPQYLYLSFGLSSIKKIFSYSAYQFLFNFINYFSRNFDKLLIGKYLNMKLLGYYDKSYRLMMLPLQNITAVITPVMHPIFSDFQHDINKLATSYERVVRLLSFIGFPLSVLFFFTSKEITLIIFGDQWLPSVPVFQILSISIGIQIILSSSGSIFQATNDTKDMFISGLLSSTLNVIGILLGTFYFGTIEAIAWCIVITFSINFVQCYLIMYKITFKRKFTLLLKQFLSPILISLILILILLPLYFLLANTNILLSFIIKGSISFVIFGCYVQFVGEYDIKKKILSMIRKLK